MTARTALICRRLTTALVLLTLAVAPTIAAPPGYADSSAPNAAAAAVSQNRSWTIVSHPRTKGIGSLRAVACRSGTDAWAVGSFVELTTGATEAVLHHWDGSTWQSVPSAAVAPQSDSHLADVDVLGKGEVVAVGHTVSAGRRQPHIEHHESPDGSSGRVAPSPVPLSTGAWQGIDLRTPTDGWVVGLTGSLTDTEPAQTLIARWDGQQWRRVPSPSPGALGSRLTAVTALAADDAWAVGTIRHAADREREETLVLHWDGSTWSRVPSPHPGAVHNTLLGVSAAGRNDIWVAGYTADSGRNGPEPYQPHAVAMHWDGGGWQVVRSVQFYATQFSDVVAVSATDVMFAGYKLSAGSEYTNFEHWNGAGLAVTNILEIPVGHGHLASALSGIAAEPNGGRLWAVGWIVRRNQTQWQPVSLRSSS